MPFYFWTTILLGGAALFVNMLGTFPKSDSPNQVLSFLTFIILFALYAWSSIKTYRHCKNKKPK